MVGAMDWPFRVVAIRSSSNQHYERTTHLWFSRKVQYSRWAGCELIAVTHDSLATQPLDSFTKAYIISTNRVPTLLVSVRYPIEQLSPAEAHALVISNILDVMLQKSKER